MVSGDKTWIAQEQPICLYLADGSGRTLIFVPSGYTITGSFDVDNNLGEFESE